MGSIIVNKNGFLDYEYLGCYGDNRHARIFGHLEANAEQNIGLIQCKLRCHAQGFKFFAYEDQLECFCGRDTIDFVQTNRKWLTIKIFGTTAACTNVPAGPEKCHHGRVEANETNSVRHEYLRSKMELEK